MTLSKPRADAPPASGHEGASPCERTSLVLPGGDDGESCTRSRAMNDVDPIALNLELPYELRSSRFAILLATVLSIYWFALFLFFLLRGENSPMDRKDKVFVGLLSIFIFLFINTALRRDLIRVDQQGVLRRDLFGSQFIPWKEMRAIRIKRELDPNAEISCPDGRPIRATVRTVIILIGSQEVITLNRHAEKLEPLVRLLHLMKPELVHFDPEPTIRNDRLW